MARADETHDRSGHDADGAGARDQHVFAHDVEGKRRVNRVAERIEDRGNLIVDGVRQLECVHCRNDDVFGETPRPIDADAQRIAAQVAASGATVAAEAASDMSLAGYSIADRKA